MKSVWISNGTALACLVLCTCAGDKAQTHPTVIVGASGTSASDFGTRAGSVAASPGTAAQTSFPVGGMRGSAGVMPNTPMPPSGAAGMQAAQPSPTAAAGSMAPGVSMSAGTGAVAAPPTVATGPLDGDPSKPVVTVDGIACGPSASALGGGNFKIGERDLIVEYPCGKHEGAHVTMVLNLHGTLIMGAPWQYQHAYFSAHRLVSSHNLIVLTPHSVSKASFGAQWGNMDNGEDIPHLLAVIDWAYKAFAKFQIRGLWVGGHSWGAGFVASTLGGGPFACHPMLADKVKGAIGMSRLGIPSCASRLSLIATRGEEENIALSDQNNVAMGHGCMLPMKGPEKVGNNDRFYFEGCAKGWVHEDYEMLGKGHIDNMDPEVVLKIVEAIKSTEQP